MHDRPPDIELSCVGWGSGNLPGHQFSCLGQENPLCLFHNPALQGFRRVLRQDLHSLLQKNWAAVGNLIDKMNRRAGYLHAPGKRCLMDVEAIKSLSAEIGNQAGMDIQNAIGPLFCEVF